MPYLWVLPELSFTGQPRDREHAQALAEPLAGACSATLTAWCAEHACYVVAGLIERDGAALYNTLALVGPGGQYAHYRKTHLSAHDQTWATPGDGLTWADTPIGRIGLLCGTDLTFAEPARCLAILGCDVVCVSAALTAPTPVYRRTFTAADDDAIHWHLARTRAGESDIYIIFANWRAGQADLAYMGHSGVFFGPTLFAAPAHEALVCAADGDEYSYAATVIDAHTQPGSALRTKPGIQRRLPSQYARLLTRPDRQPAKAGNNR
jgi:predicted amidohydrolase